MGGGGGSGEPRDDVLAYLRPGCPQTSLASRILGLVTGSTPHLRTSTASKAGSWITAWGKSFSFASMHSGNCIYNTFKIYFAARLQVRNSELEALKQL